MDADVLLQVKRLDASYGSIKILRSVEFAVRSGHSVSILGANGAGKSTLLRAIAGITVKREGFIRFADREIDTLRTDQIVEAGISLVPDGRQLFAPLSVQKNLEIGGLCLRRRGRRKEAEAALNTVWDLFPQLAERRRQTVGTLSGGEQQMVAIGRALAAQPRLLLLDEPTVGLAPKIIEHLFEVFHKLKGGGLTIILAEQNVRLALDLADEAVLLDIGHVAASGSATEMRGNSTIQRIYLGH